MGRMTAASSWRDLGNADSVPRKRRSEEMDTKTQNSIIERIQVGSKIQLSIDGGKVWGNPYPVTKIEHSFATYYNRPSAHVSVKTPGNGWTSFGFHAGEIGIRVRLVE